MRATENIRQISHESAANTFENVQDMARSARANMTKANTLTTLSSLYSTLSQNLSKNSPSDPSFTSTFQSLDKTRNSLFSHILHDIVTLDTDTKKGRILRLRNAFKYPDPSTERLIFKEGPLLTIEPLSEDEFDEVQRRCIQQLQRSGLPAVLKDLPLALGVLKRSNVEWDLLNDETLGFGRLVWSLFSPRKDMTQAQWDELRLETKVYGDYLALNFDKCFPERSDSEYQSVVDRVAHLVSIANNNAFGGWDGNLLLYPVTSRLSHSCLPNCSWSIDKDGMMHIKAIVDEIPANEELTISYFSPEALENPHDISTVSRRKYLYGCKYFVCECYMCSREDRTRAFKCTACKGGVVHLNDRLPHMKKEKKNKGLHNKCDKCKSAQQASLFKSLEAVWNQALVPLRREVVHDSDVGEVLLALEDFEKEVAQHVAYHWLLFEIRSRLYDIYSRKDSTHCNPTAALRLCRENIHFLEHCLAPEPIGTALADWYQNMGQTLIAIHSLGVKGKEGTAMLQEALSAHETALAMKKKLSLDHS